MTRQAHVDLPEGTYEEEFARRGFFGRTSHLYRTEPPVAWTAIEGDLRPEAFRATSLTGSDDWIAGRVALLENDDVRIAISKLTHAMPFAYRNADGDELVFVHEGAGDLASDFGTLSYAVGDYLVIPRGTTYRLAPSAPTTALVVESTGEISLPDRGLLGRHALFDEGVIDVPDVPANQATLHRSTEVRVRRLGRMSTITYPFDPLTTTAGWRGDLSVWRLNVRDIRPVSSERYHLPPPAHATWVMPNAVVCTFLPRPLETGDPGALRVPFYHANIDYDEVLFYHAGEFFSREGIAAGMMTFHPQGIHHGPQPQAVRRAETRTRTNEQAVMIDTARPLRLTAAARETRIADYWRSWTKEEK